MNEEELLDYFLSNDEDKVYKASREIFVNTLIDTYKLKYLKKYIREIKESTKNLKLGGGIVSFKRFLNKAIELIEHCEDNCFCEMMFDKYGQNANSLRVNGFIILNEEVDSSNFITIITIECPICHQKYEVKEIFTGWHMNANEYKKIP